MKATPCPICAHLLGPGGFCPNDANHPVPSSEPKPHSNERRNKCYHDERNVAARLAKQYSPKVLRAAAMLAEAFE